MATAQQKQALRDNRKKQGLCIYCGAPADNGTRCTRCTERDKENRRRQAERKSKRGICKNTGCSNQVIDGHSYCDACNEKSAARTLARRRRRVESGICAYCNNPVLPGLTRCKEHKDKLKESIKTLIAKRVASGKCGRCGDYVLVPGYKQCQVCIDLRREAHRQLTQEVLDAYGGPVCCGCGEDNFWVLQIDHINGGGNQHAKQIGSGDATRGRGKMYRWLKDNNFPLGFRVLCANCNIKAARRIPLPNDQQ